MCKDMECGHGPVRDIFLGQRGIRCSVDLADRHRLLGLAYLQGKRPGGYGVADVQARRKSYRIERLCRAYGLLTGMELCDG